MFPCYQLHQACRWWLKRYPSKLNWNSNLAKYRLPIAYFSRSQLDLSFWGYHIFPLLPKYRCQMQRGICSPHLELALAMHRARNYVWQNHIIMGCVGHNCCPCHMYVHMDVPLSINDWTATAGFWMSYQVKFNISFFFGNLWYNPLQILKPCLSFEAIAL